MKKLIEGIKEFRKTRRNDLLGTFGKIGLAQKPDAILIACSDSRVVPNLFASTSPGELFVLRNMGAIIPPYCAEMEETSVLSVFEFALSYLPIRDIIVCGHSNCGAMHALLRNSIDFEGVARWLDSAKNATEALQLLPEGADQETKANAISQLSVLKQIDNLKTYPIIQKHLKEGNIELHAWWFDITQADVYSFDFSKGEYVLIE